jgi:tripartite ATP-independent transporter DctM subunit
MAFATFMILFVVLFAIGMPIAFTMIVSAVVYALMTHASLGLLSMEMYKSLNSFVLIAIPMFILTAEVMGESTVADKMFGFANSLVGWIPGGLGHVNVFSNIIFAGMSGSAAADAGGIGLLCYKSMANKGFDKSFSAALTAATACIGPIIPPSIPMVIYAMVANESVGKLLLGGVAPGLLMGAAMMIVIFFVSRKRGYPVEQRMSFKEICIATKEGILPVLTPIVLLVTITSGIVTVTEGAIITVLYSCFLGGVIYRQLGFKKFLGALERVFISTGIIVSLFPATRIFSYVLTKESIPLKFAELFVNASVNPIIILVLVNILFLILGCLSDPLVNIMLFVPLVLPLVNVIHMNPVHFGVMIVLNAMVGLVTPPVGGMLFITAAVTKVPIKDIIRESWGFITILLVVLVVTAAFPPVVTWLPNMFFK